MTPYEQGYQAGVCYLPFDTESEAEKERYLATLTEAERQEYYRGWLDGYSGIERAELHSPRNEVQP